MLEIEQQSIVSNLTCGVNQSQSQPSKRKRNQAGNPDPDAEVVALSPKSLLATNRFVCEICKKGFQREQNLQLHRRGHNLPWKLKQRSSKKKKKVYVCPERSCVHNHPSRALGDLTGIKKHFCRKHGERKWKCHKCSKKYAVQSDWKAHSKTCGTRDYRCHHCRTLFSRRDSFITHRAFCDALLVAEEPFPIKKEEWLLNPNPSTMGPIAHFLHHNQAHVSADDTTNSSADFEMPSSSRDEFMMSPAGGISNMMTMMMNNSNNDGFDAMMSKTRDFLGLAHTDMLTFAACFDSHHHP